MDKKYLLLRKRGWYVRYAIPLKVQHHFGKSEFVVSLRTRSFEEAKIKKLQYLEAFTRAISAHLNFDINQESNITNTYFDEWDPWFSPNGDKIVYSTSVGLGTTQPQSITGLTTYTGITSTSIFYQVLRLDDNSFRIADVGLGGTITNNFDRLNYIKFSDQGTGFQVFKYEDINLNLKFELKNTTTGIITASPVVRGSIDDIYLYEKGSGYGSNILNLEKTSKITVQTGKNAELKPIVSDGKISYVEIQAKVLN